MKKYLSIAAAALLALGSCTRTVPFDLPPDRENYVTIERDSLPIERTLSRPGEIEYPDGNLAVAAREGGVALTVMAEGATVKAELPQRLVGDRIDFSERDATPGTDGVYYTFHLSERGEGGVYCRIQSWITESGDDGDRRNDYGGWFSVARGDGDGEYVFEWELTAPDGGETVSTGYVAGAFAPVP